MLSVARVLTILSLLVLQVFGDLPKVIKRCPAGAQFEACLKTVFEDLKPYVSRGDFGEGFKHTPLEPFLVDALNITSPELNLSLSNMVINHATTFKPVSFKFDLQKLNFDLAFITPYVKYKSDYLVSQIVPFVNIQVKARGEQTGILKGINARMKLKLQSKNNMITVKSLQYRARIEDGQFKIKTLRDLNDSSGKSNQLLLDIVNNFINMNPTFVLRRIEPGFESQFLSVLTEIVNTVLKNVKTSDLFAT